MGGAGVTDTAPKPKDRRAITSRQNARLGGRPKIAPDARTYKVIVPADLHAWLREQGAAGVRKALERWRIDSLVV